MLERLKSLYRQQLGAIGVVEIVVIALVIVIVVLLLRH